MALILALMALKMALMKRLMNGRKMRVAGMPQDVVSPLLPNLCAQQANVYQRD